jgi:ABC-type sugar transport system substrate-binding protein
LSRTVVLSLLNNTGAYQKLMRADAERTAARLGLALQIHDAAESVTEQIRFVRDCIRRPEAERPHAVVIFPARDQPMERLVEEIVGARVGCIVLNRRAEYVAALRSNARGLALSVVGPDQMEIGRLQARQARALATAGYVLCVQGMTMASTARDRLAGLREGLNGTKLTVAQVIGNWQASEAEQAVASWLAMVVPSGVRLALVSCQNDTMAAGARRALERTAAELKRPDLTRVPITGVDGTAADGTREVDAGRMAATVVVLSSTGPAIELLARSLKGEAIPGTLVLPVTSYPTLEAVARTA